MAIPRGLAFGSASGIDGSPVELENRTVMEVEALLKWGAVERFLASGDGVNLPLSSFPFACATTHVD